MSRSIEPTENHLLGMPPAEDQARLFPLLEPVTLTLGQVLCESGDSCSLMSRALTLTLAKAQAPALHAVRVRPDGSFEGREPTHDDEEPSIFSAGAAPAIGNRSQMQRAAACVQLETSSA